MAAQRRLWVLKILRLVAAAIVALGGYTGIVLGQSEDREVVVIHLADAISPTSAQYLAGALGAATRGGASAVVVRLDTPGGRVDAMRTMVTSLLDARVPVICYVGPAGAQAASAGTFVAVAGHIAVMARGTNVGAAAPVDPTGQDLPDTLKDKTIEDLAALVREIASVRGRNADALEETVRSARAYGAAEAVELGVVDMVVADLPDLLRRVDGLTVSVNSPGNHETAVVLRTDGAAVIDVHPSLLDRVQSFLTDPTVAYLLLSLGSLLLWVEAISGFAVLVVGLTGAVLMGLGFVGLVNLPPQWLGAGLIVAGVLLMIGEANIDGFGVLGASAIIAFIVGSVLLMLHFSAQTPSWNGRSVSLFVLIPVVVAVASAGGLMVGSITLNRRRPSIQPNPILVGSVGVVETALSPEGIVFVTGERWRGRPLEGGSIESGTSVRVRGADGATLLVAPLEEGPRRDPMA